MYFLSLRPVNNPGRHISRVTRAQLGNYLFIYVKRQTHDAGRA